MSDFISDFISILKDNIFNLIMVALTGAAYFITKFVIAWRNKKR